MAIDYIRLSQQGKDQLIKLKRYTGIEHWNVLCRWAFCLSLSEPSVPPNAKIPADSNVEMTWKVFGGRAPRDLSRAAKGAVSSGWVRYGPGNNATSVQAPSASRDFLPRRKPKSPRHWEASCHAAR